MSQVPGTGRPGSRASGAAVGGIYIHKHVHALV